MSSFVSTAGSVDGMAWQSSTATPPQRARPHPRDPSVPAREQLRPTSFRLNHGAKSILPKVEHRQEALETGH
jgi:hypothetical protein